jgi:hypothetical protein
MTARDAPASIWRIPMTKLKSALLAATAAAGFLMMTGAFASAGAPLQCRHGNALQMRGDAPAAISYDV